MLLAQELVALLGLLVFLDGHQVHGPHLVNALLQALNLLRHCIPIGGHPRGSHFFRRHHMHLGRPFIGKRNGDALAANIVELEMILLLDALPQVLNGHVLLRQLDFDRAPLLLQVAQSPPLLPQALFTRSNVRFLRLLLRPPVRRFAH